MHKRTWSKRLILAGVLLSLLCLAMPPHSALQAQRSPNEIKYGETVDVEFTSEVRRASFRFTGKAGEIAVVQLVPTLQNAMTGALVSVTDDRDRALADSSRLIVFGSLGEMLAAELPEDGTYSVNVFTRESDTSSGAMQLMLLLAPKLQIGTPVEDVAISTTEDRYTRYNTFYAIDSTDDVTLTFEHTGTREFMPWLVVYTALDGNVLYPVAYLGGEAALGGTLTLAGSRQLTLVGVGPFGLSAVGRGKSEQLVDFTLTLSAAQ